MFFRKQPKQANDQPTKPAAASRPKEATAAVKPKGDAAAPAPAPLSPEEAKRRAVAARRLAATFGDIVSLLMRAPQYKKHSLADLEWLVVPALMTGQFSVTTAQSKSSGATTPVGLVLWARVSAEVDKRLSAASGQAIRLTPQEWRSGDKIWVTASVGDTRVLQAMLKRLQEKDWGGKPAKVIAVSKDGKPAVATLAAKAA
jgi:cytolysin-activating lysine-acyltransferase